MTKVPFRKIEHEDEATSKLQDNVEEAINRITAQTLDDQADGKTYRKLIGVNYAHQLTASGIAANTITSGQIAAGTVTGTNIATATVAVANLAPCNQFQLYRNAAQTIPAGTYAAMYADTVVKDAGNGWSASNAWYVLPAAGDWFFSWNFRWTATAAGQECTSRLVINSGVAAQGLDLTSGAASAVGTNGGLLVAGLHAGMRVKVEVFAPITVAYATGSGANYFTGYQVR